MLLATICFFSSCSSIVYFLYMFIVEISHWNIGVGGVHERVLQVKKAHHMAGVSYSGLITCLWASS